MHPIAAHIAPVTEVPESRLARLSTALASIALTIVFAPFLLVLLIAIFVGEARQSCLDRKYGEGER